MAPRKTTTNDAASPSNDKYDVRRYGVYDKMNPRARYEYLANPNNQQPQTSFIYLDPQFTFLGIERLRSYAEAISHQQNDPIIASCLSDFANLCVGAKGGLVHIQSTDDKFSKNANWYFNKVWSRDASWRDRSTLNEMLWTIVISANRDGDCLVVLDKDVTNGKLIVYESDQIVSIESFATWKIDNGLEGDYKQVDGVVYTPDGKLYGYFVTNKRAKKTVPNHEAVFVKSEICYLHIAERYRANMARGESKLLSLMTILEHNRKMIESTVISAQRAAEDIAVKKIKNPVSNLMSLTQQGQFGITQTPATYTPLGGGEVTIGPEDSYEILTNTKPESNITEFGDWFRRVVYRRYGMTDIFANGTCKTKDQGKSEMILTHIAVSSYQEKLSGLLEWIVKTTIDNSPFAVKDAIYSVECLWPELPTAEFDLTVADKIARLRLGGSSFKEEFGPDWQNSIEEFASELEWLKAHGMENLSVFETVAGKNEAMNAQNKQSTKETKENN